MGWGQKSNDCCGGSRTDNTVYFRIVSTGKPPAAMLTQYLFAYSFINTPDIIAGDKALDPCS